MTQPPADAYPVAVHAADRRVTPDSVRLESTPEALMLWIGDTMISVPLNGDDTKLQAALNLAWHTREVVERFGAQVRAQLDDRARARANEATAAAIRAVENPARPYVPAAAEDAPAPGAPA
ncbi:hypothetical protein [Nonomuraea sp. CA-141351]|uniref:hypothetical protein n=1 Tax=Nonomuraea sp. CA-141351 TaxID=3239996 RepID=UPI003D8F438C